MYWTFLFLAGLLEIAWVIGLKYSQGFTVLIPSLLTVSCMTVGFWLLSVAMRGIPLGTAYAVWTGIGTVGAAIFGMILFKEPATVIRIVCIMLILAGIVGLKMSSPN